jgi:SAM-dependent methyltransferase
MMLSTEVPFELQLLSQATNYQRWVMENVRPFLGNRILEFGAGIGNMSRWLPVREKLILTESDRGLFSKLEAQVKASFSGDARVQTLPLNIEAETLGTFSEESLDTIVSFNVLEHIEDDRKVVSQCLDLLRKSKAPGPKRLISFVPAHGWAFGSMDREFGHFRRYHGASFKKMVGDAPIQLWQRHFNLFGLPGWVVTGRWLKKKSIDPSTVKIFERLCPILKGADQFIHRVLRVPLGQSLLCVMTIPARTAEERTH